MPGWTPQRHAGRGLNSQQAKKLGDIAGEVVSCFSRGFSVVVKSRLIGSPVMVFPSQSRSVFGGFRSGSWQDALNIEHSHQPQCLHTKLLLIQGLGAQTYLESLCCICNTHTHVVQHLTCRELSWLASRLENPDTGTIPIVLGSNHHRCYLEYATPSDLSEARADPFGSRPERWGPWVSVALYIRWGICASCRNTVGRKLGI